jgi:hypothetical protein
MTHTATYPPEDVMLGGAVGAEVLLATTPVVAVALTDVVAYPEGFVFTLRIRFRPGETAPGDLNLALPPRVRRGGPALELRYADGATAAVGGPSIAGRLAIWDDGFESTDQGSDHRHWVSPLPPPGPVELSFSWPDQGIHGATGSLDAAVLREAAGRARFFWPQTGRGASGRQRAEAPTRQGEVVLTEDEQYDDHGILWTGRFSGYWHVPADEDAPESELVEMERVAHLEIDEALAWARARAPVVLVRPGDSDYLSAGDEPSPDYEAPWPGDHVRFEPRRAPWFQERQGLEEM